MLSLAEAQMRMNGRFGGSKSRFPCDDCTLDGSFHLCPDDKYSPMTLGSSPQFKEMSDAEKSHLLDDIGFIRAHYGNFKVGYPCETMNRWLFGLDDMTRDDPAKTAPVRRSRRTNGFLPHFQSGIQQHR